MTAVLMVDGAEIPTKVRVTLDATEMLYDWSAHGTVAAEHAGAVLNAQTMTLRFGTLEGDCLLASMVHMVGISQVDLVAAGPLYVVRNGQREEFRP